MNEFSLHCKKLALAPYPKYFIKFFRNLLSNLISIYMGHGRKFKEVFYFKKGVKRKEESSSGGGMSSQKEFSQIIR